MQKARKEYNMKLISWNVNGLKKTEKVVMP